MALTKKEPRKKESRKKEPRKRESRKKEPHTLNWPDLKQRLDPSTPWEKRLIIEPFFTSSINDTAGSISIDFHLGNRFTLPRSRRSAQHDPLTGNPRQDVVARELFIPMGQDFTLNPGQIVLATTFEWFRFPFDLMAFVIGRSIWGRRGLSIVTASAVHPGSSGTITLEMSNLGEVGLHLKPGAAIGQLFFNMVEPAEGMKARRSTFSGAHRPILGKYSPTTVEKFLLKL
jgi:dCTP deaminase